MTRDQQIYIERKTQSVKALAEKYGVSTRRVIAICRLESLKEDNETLRQQAAQWRGKYYKLIIAQNKNR